MCQELTGKVAIITGGTSGIGLATVELFITEGAKVIIADIDKESGKSIEERFGEVVKFVYTDVTSEKDIENVVNEAIKQYGHMDIMVNNAGAGGDPSNITNLTEEGFSKSLKLLLDSVLWGHKYAIRSFRSQGVKGTVVTTSSAAGIQPGWGGASYTIAKHGVVGIVSQTAFEVAKEGIRCNGVAPGITLTPIMTRTFNVPLEKGEEFLKFLNEEVGSSQPLGRMAESKEVAEAILWLASPRSSYVTGHILPVTGGSTVFYDGNFGSLAANAAEKFLHR